MKAEHEAIRDINPLCCNYDCNKYPSWHERCFNENYKCVWFAIAAKVKNDNLKTK